MKSPSSTPTLLSEPSKLEQAEQGYSTRAVQSGIPRTSQHGVGFAVQNMVAFQFETLEEGAEVFTSGEGYSYARVQNPTVKALEQRLSALEGAYATVALASGQAASFTAMLSTCRVGDHIVASSSVFGGTSGLLNNVLPNLGIRSSLVENTAEAVQAALTPDTRLVWVETLGNPVCDVPDLERIAQIAHTHGALLCVDNTWAGIGLLCRPFEYGADLIVHSLTKWAGGQGTVLGGAVMVRDGVNLSSLPMFTLGSPSLLKQRGEGALAWKLRSIGAQQIGMTLSPQSAASFALGVETLELRLTRESETALELARWLEPRVQQVLYAGLPSSKWHALAQKYLQGGFGSVLSFEVNDPSSFLSRLQLVRIAPNIGDTRTLAIHPWTTTHSRLSEAGKYHSGVTPQLIRLSVGLERVSDLLADLAQALE